MIRWKGREPKITREQYDQLVARLAVRRWQNNTRTGETVADLAREFGIPLATAYSAARYGIKRYEVDR